MRILVTGAAGFIGSAYVHHVLANHPGDDVYRLARTPVQVSDGHRWFLNKARGGMAFEEDLRSVLNRRRYRNLHN